MDKVLHAPMPFTTGGQTINDRLMAAKHSISGSQLGKVVCKATTEEVMGPKKKHLDYLLRFIQYLASSNASLNLGNFLDKTSVQGYDMSTHVRRYAKYISEKIYTYRLCAFDFCKVKRGKDDGLLRTMNTEKLLKTLPILQGQIDTLIEFQVNSSELTNGVINSAFILLFRDLIRLFACYNDGVINLLEKFFDMNKKQAREALDLYKKFLTRMDNVAEFLKVAESVGIDRGEIPDLAKAPNSLLEALEQHLAQLEGNKPNSRVTSPLTTGAGVQHVISSFTTSSDSSFFNTNALDEATRKKYIEEEQERLNALKEQRMRELEFGSSRNTNPFLPSSSGTTSNGAHAGGNTQQLFDDDLLSLNVGVNNNSNSNNPFAAASAANSSNLFDVGWNSTPMMQPAYMSSGNMVQPIQSSNMFASDDHFAKAFAGNNTNGQDSKGYYETGGLGAPAPPSRGESPAHVSAMYSTNPFAAEAFGAAAPWSSEGFQESGAATPEHGTFGSDSTAFASSATGYTWAPTQIAYDSSDEGLASQQLTTHGQNPFAAFQQNAASFAKIATKDGEATALSVNTQNAWEDAITPTPSPVPSNTDYTTSVAPEDSESVVPMAPQAPGGLNIYQHTPFSGFDPSYSGSPQLPRHMASGGPPTSCGLANGAPTAFGITPPPQRPSSNPSADLVGLDPLGSDLFSVPQQKRPQDSKIIKGDLDSSLASLAENLTMDRTKSQKGPMAGPPRLAAQTTVIGWNQPPMGYGMPGPYVQPAWGAPPMMGNMQQMSGYAPRPMTGIHVQPRPSMQQNQQSLDPFGAL